MQEGDQSTAVPDVKRPGCKRVDGQLTEDEEMLPSTPLDLPSLEHVPIAPPAS